VICAYCEKPGGTYSLACLGCCRRLWKNSLPANRDGILSMVEAFGSQDIADRIRSGTRKTKSGAGSGSTHEL
jgi:hypothetical protein